MRHNHLCHFQQSSSCHKNLETVTSCEVKNVTHDRIFRLLGDPDNFWNHRAVKKELHSLGFFNTPECLENGKEVGAGDHVGVEEGDHREPGLHQGWAATAQEKVLNGAHSRLDDLAEGTDPLLVGVVPVPGEGLHPRSP